MGIDTQAKRLAMARYGRAWNAPADVATVLGELAGDARETRAEVAAVRASAAADETFREGGHAEDPPPPRALFIDANYVLKYSSPALETGLQFVNEHVLAPVHAFTAAGGHTVALCFDRASPPNKSEEHRKRYARTQPMPTPPPDIAAALVSDEAIVDADLWRPFTSNRYLAAQLVHYVTRTILGEHLPELARYTPPVHGRLFLHGGRRDPPPHPSTGVPAPPGQPPQDGGRASPEHGTHRQDGRMSAGRVPAPAPELLYVHHGVFADAPTREQIAGLPQHYRQHLLERQRAERRTGVDPAHAPAVLGNLLEGELAVAYYAVHAAAPHEDAAFLTVDGDLVLILLLLARDRIDPATGRFRNRHVLWLKVPGAGGTDTVDINALYEDISEDPALSGVHDPVLTWCLLTILIKNDFVHGYAPGIGTWRGDDRTAQDSSADMPFVFRAFLDAPDAWGALARVLTADRGDPRRPLEVAVDRALFRRFTHYLYLRKWWPTMRRLATRIEALAAPPKRGTRAARTPAQVAHALRWDDAACAVADPVAWAAAIRALEAVTGPRDSPRALLTSSPAQLDAATAAVRTYLQHQQRKKPANHLPSDDAIDVKAEQVGWVLGYWLNGYRGTCAVEPPLARLNDVSRHGWERDHRGWVVSAARVAPPARTAGGHRLEDVLRRSANRTPPPGGAPSIRRRVLPSLVPAFPSGSNRAEEEEDQEEEQEDDEREPTDAAAADARATKRARTML